ncbi:type VII secretion protein EssA [Fictibacillus sp. b24]|uniref:type VII secretion protein EssA n=1 Tax=Fictibacillus sp. b24 TaxID=3055863 RepID=UPI0025A2C8C4|nr:type VII secretion protein EssA [Fictibacillus sp. b24]MDM5318059.1 type VII secretion protein EssA [Fictibacillus sp. b24]
MKLIKQILIMSVVSLIFLGPNSAFAGKSINELTPNQYEKNNNKEDAVLKESLTDIKQRLPEEQKGLTFTKDAENKFEDVKDGLFSQTVTSINNSITSKAKKMGLFSKEKEDVLSISADNENKQSLSDSVISISMIYMILIVLGILVMVVLLMTGTRRNSRNEGNLLQ